MSDPGPPLDACATHRPAGRAPPSHRSGGLGSVPVLRTHLIAFIAPPPEASANAGGTERSVEPSVGRRRPGVGALVHEDRIAGHLTEHQGPEPWMLTDIANDPTLRATARH